MKESDTQAIGIVFLAALFIFAGHPQTRQTWGGQLASAVEQGDRPPSMINPSLKLASFIEATGY